MLRVHRCTNLFAELAPLTSQTHRALSFICASLPHIRLPAWDWSFFHRYIVATTLPAGAYAPRAVWPLSSLSTRHQRYTNSKVSQANASSVSLQHSFSSLFLTLLN